MADSGVNLGPSWFWDETSRSGGVRVLNFSQERSTPWFLGTWKGFEPRTCELGQLLGGHLPLPKHPKRGCDCQDILRRMGERMNALPERTLDRYEERQRCEAGSRPLHRLVGDGETKTKAVKIVRPNRHIPVPGGDNPNLVANLLGLETERRSAVLLEEGVVLAFGEHIHPLWREKFISFSPENGKYREGCDRRTVRASDATHNPPAPVGLTSNYLIFAHIPNYFHPHICSEHSRSIVGYSHWYRPTLCSTLYNIDGVIYVGEKNSPDFLSIDTRNIYILANKEDALCEWI